MAMADDFYTRFNALKARAAKGDVAAGLQCAAMVEKLGEEYAADCRQKAAFIRANPTTPYGEPSEESTKSTGPHWNGEPIGRVWGGKHV